MNQKKSSKIIIIAILIVLILVILAGVAYAYLATDLLKSEKSLFFKYISQTVDTENGFIENQMKEYFEKRKNIPYTTDGSFSAAIQGSEEVIEQVSNTNNMDISFSGQVDTANSTFVQDISINYSDNVNFPFSLKKTGDTIGLQTEYIGSKYITIDTSTSGSSGTSSSTNQIEGVAQGIEKIEEVSDIEFSAEELQHIRDTYLEVLNQNLQDSNFAKVNEAGAQGYQLSLTSEESKNLEIKLLETLKNDQITLDKLNEYAQLQSTSNQITQNDIDDMIDEINGKILTEETNIKITIYQKNGQTSKIVVENEIIKIAFEKIKDEDELQYNISIEKMEDGQTAEKLYLNASYSGLQMLQAVNENYELGLEIASTSSSMEIISRAENANGLTEQDTSSENETLSYKYNFNNNVEFQEVLDIEEFTQENSLNLMNLGETQRTSFMEAVAQRLKEVNKKQMGELELSENENPIIYMIPLLAVGQNATLSSANEMTQMEISSFNSKFEMYEGTNISGATVKGLLTIISDNNGLEDDEDETSSMGTSSITSETNQEEKLIKEINFNGEEYEVNRQNIASIRGEISTEDYFRVEFEKDEDTGRIYRVVINKK